MLRILALEQLVNVATGSVGYLLSMTGHERLLRNNVLAAAVVALDGALVLIPAFGLIGTAVATATGIAIQNLLCVWQVRRVLGFKMMLLTLVFSLILVLTSWPGSSASLGGVDLSLYREPSYPKPRRGGHGELLERLYLI
ncbi:MAG: polysaccharide biosynthesis C-terminal domain-containing protein [Lamprobacter sp.]|uniref:polysaccharide biosynthesis C-terminal domain-containing protein n=1 Tax=Lamprobacter sp. TaxID=3100796 RepID=UPI002B2587BF|nr:polysaccharide biosynthesis C-terminal domain-containing protein [Lamprobacter sp.]MEA3643989.1 polysaccharide biosynthesis C-terminal domain-containing protein [Lamprobacter sp.]